MSESPAGTTTLGAQGEPCASCGAPLAADQRYCLQCGTRRAEARLPFRDVLARDRGGPPGPPPRDPFLIAAEPPPPDGLRRDLAFLAGLACLLLALGVGVLIGRSGQNDTPAKPAPPQVISLSGAAPAATSTDATATGTTTGSSSSASSPPKGKAGAAKAGAAKTTKQSKATNTALKALDTTNGNDYARKSKKLPKTVGTGGKPPPVDKSKPAGAGSSVQTIG
jgi:hypothetical protein